ncbi:hypothetical protein [Streptomyces sp. NPDC058424]|uniref:hypothetical protein n=1 Tax=Streptomyces sp. NPDC058424 TaxID=3346491 RepID=UPI003658B0E1
MNTKLVGQAADVIARSMENGRQTPAAWAIALESARLLQSPDTASEQVLPPEVAVELNDLRARVAGMANPPRELFLALYEGAEPELFTTVEAARACCDDLAETDAHGRCWDWQVNEYRAHVQFWTHPDDDRPMGETPGHVTPIVVQGDEPVSELERLRARVVELERRIEAEECCCPEPAPLCQGCRCRCHAKQAEKSADRWSRFFAPVQALREEEPADASPQVVFRASHDSIVMGLYTTREAAQAHCEAEVQQEEPQGSIQHLSWSADDIGPDAEYELHITPAETGGLIRGTSYVVTPLEVASAYDPDGDE